MKCTFFGHSDAGDEIEEKLKTVIISLAEDGVDTFYVGTHGNFDKMAYKLLCNLSQAYDFKFFTVLSHIPVKDLKQKLKNTIVPEGIENVPPRCGIIYRNKWMADKADFVITYVNRSFGGAAKFKEYSQKQKKTIIEI